VTGAADAVRTALVQVPGVVRTLVRQADGKLVVGGDFHYAGCEVRRHLARANADGTLDTSWQPNADNEVLALATIGPDLYVGGRFTQIGGMTRHGLARFRAAGPDVPDAQWNPAGPLSEVYAIALDPATNVLVGGRFIEMGGAMRTNLAKLASTNEGTADATWAPNAHRGTLLPQIGVVRVIVPRGTDVFIGGDFRRVSGTARTNLAKLDLATGAADPLWVPNPSEVSTISALAVSGSNVFVGGRFTGVDSISGKSLAKMSADGPAVIDRTWNPMPYFGGRFAFAEALALSGTNLYVAGRFLTIGGQLRNGLARISTEGTGLADPRWDPQPRFARDNSADPGDPFLCALVLHQGNVFAGGEFTAMGHATRFGLALIAELDAPVMVKTGPAAFTVLRGPSDGDEVRHFQITTIEGATLYQSDGRTEVRVRDYITIEQGAAGLVVATNDPYARISAVSAVGTRPEDTGVLEGSLEFGGVQTPVFRIGAPSYFVNEDGFSALMTVEKRGLGPGAVQYVVEPGTAEPHDLDCGIGDYVALPGDTLNFTASETVKTFVVFIVDDDKTEGDETFTFRLTRALGNGQLAGPSFAPVTIVDNEKTGPLGSFTQHERPAPASTASGALRVHLQSPGDAGQWRLEGETAWRDSDDTVRGLSTGTYVVEFKPLPNLTEPPAQAVFVESPQTANLLAQYEARGGPGTAGLKVVIQPDAIARHPEEIHRGQWRLEGESLWRDSDQTYTLPVGNYVIEFKPVPGFVAPASRIAVVVPELQVIAGSYLAAPPVLGQQPAVLPLETVTNTEPYLYNGQVRTEFGVGSGVVVKPRVVLTAAHIVFDDRTLSSAAEMKWHFQRRAGEFEPAPQLARGAFLLAGYATQRTNDLADGVPPGESTPASQAHDVAALYFLERDGDPNLPGRGGFGGFLSSDADPHEWLISDRLKFLAGYPVQRVNPGEAGRLHATSPTNALFTRLYGQVHRTEDFVSFPGASGGPVYVQADDGTYYPAAIYLGGSAISLVRAIDCYVVDLINRAELLANGAGNHGGFGVTRYVAAGSAGISVGLIQVLLGPTSEEQMQGGWRVVNPANPNAPWITDTNLFKPAIGSPAIQPIEFRPLPGRATPAPRDVQFVAGQINVITVSYRPFLLELQPPAAAGHLSFLVHAATGRVYVIEESADLEHWSPVGRLTNTSGTTPLSLPIDPSVAHRFFRGLEP
ncbi:MAG TPA: Calx-beta domain-containing protein, partial [Methylomirabilota bacterium]|nr:Calx-beta domain-containing protein [Methylomirabilota bacterium]